MHMYNNYTLLAGHKGSLWLEISNKLPAAVQPFYACASSLGDP